jgi:hypothetical protein
MNRHHDYLLFPTKQRLSSKLPFTVGAVTGLSSDSTTNFLEVHRLLKMAGCLKRAVIDRTVPSDFGCYPKIGRQPHNRCNLKSNQRAIVSKVHDLYRHDYSSSEPIAEPRSLARQVRKSTEWRKNCSPSGVSSWPRPPSCGSQLRDLRHKAAFSKATSVWRAVKSWTEAYAPTDTFAST